jgi:hypothetical protein
MNTEKNVGPITDAVTSQLTSTFGNRLPTSDEAKKQQRAQRFATEIAAQKKESAEKALDKSQRFGEFVTARSAGIQLSGAYAKHYTTSPGDQVYVTLANKVAGGWDDFVRYVVQHAVMDQLDLRDDVARQGQKRFEIELSGFFSGTQFENLCRFGQRATIVGSISSTGLEVFHVGPG